LEVVIFFHGISIQNILFLSLPKGTEGKKENSSSKETFSSVDFLSAYIHVSRSVFHSKPTRQLKSFPE